MPAAALDGDGQYLYVPNRASSDVTVIDHATRQVAVVDIQTQRLIKTIDNVGDEPWGATMVGALNYCH